MIYLKWLSLTLIDYLLLIPFFIAAPFVSLFTANGWGIFESTFATPTSPPQGDAGWIRERSPYPQIITGWRGYINRVCWLWRNPNYPFQIWSGIPCGANTVVFWNGDDKISDKYARAGYYFAQAKDLGEVVAFEFYAIIPYSKTKCFRARLGWKIMSSKFVEGSMAQLVNTVTPIKEYGESVK